MINSKRFAVFTVAALAGIASASAALNVPTQNCSYVFNKNTKLGSMDSEVMNLQKVLNAYPQTEIASTGAGSKGMETNYFGAKTKAAVIKFQELHKADVLTPIGATTGTGNVFSLTRAVLKQVCVGGTTTTPTTTPTTSGSVTVSLAAVQPTNVLVAGQATAKIADVVFSGNGTVNNIKFEKTGISNNATLKNVYLYDGMTRIAGPASVTTVTNSAGTMSVINFNSVSGLFTVAGTRTLSVRSDIDTGTSGQSVGVRLFSYTVAGASEASLSLVGNNLPIASVSLLTADFPTGNSANPSGTPQVEAGSINQTVWSRNLSVGTRIGKLHALTVKMIGSAPVNTLANVKLFVDGTQVSTAAVDATGYVNFDLSASPLSLSTGSHIVDVRADVVAGVDRTFYMVLEQASDIRLEDSQVPGAFVTVTTNSGSTAVNLVGGTFTVKPGNIVVSQDTSFNSTTNLVGGSSNVKMAAYKLTAYGEDVKVTSLTFTPTFTGLAPAATTLANVGLYVNGGQVNSNQTATHATALTFNNLGTNLVVPAGQTVTVELRGDVMSSSNVNYTAGTVKFDLAAGVNNTQGMISSKIGATTPYVGRNLTIASTNVNFNKTNGFSASTKAPGTVEAKIGSYTLSTGSAEGAKVTNIAVDLSGSTLVTSNNLSSLTVKDGSTVLGSVIGNPTNGVNNFSVNITVPVNSSKTFDIYANIGGNAAGQTVAPSMTLTYLGSVSNLNSTAGPIASPVTSTGAAVLVTTGTTLKTTSPVAQYIIGGNSFTAIATFNVKTNNGIAAQITKLNFAFPADTVSELTVNGQLAQITSATTATINGLAINVPSSASGVDLVIDAKFTCVVNLTCAISSNSPTSISLVGLEYNDGANPQVLATSAVSPTHKIVVTKPTVTINAGQEALQTGTAKPVATITVKADAAGDLKIAQLPILMQFPASLTVANLRISDDNGNTPINGTSVIASVTSGTAANVAFTAGNEASIVKAGTRTFTVYADISGTPLTNESVTTSLGASANFLWNDVDGAVNGITGSLLGSGYASGSRQLKN